MSIEYIPASPDMLSHCVWAYARLCKHNLHETPDSVEARINYMTAVNLIKMLAIVSAERICPDLDDIVKFDELVDENELIAALHMLLELADSQLDTMFYGFRPFAEFHEDDATLVRQIRDEYSWSICDPYERFTLFNCYFAKAM